MELIIAGALTIAASAIAARYRIENKHLQDDLRRLNSAVEVELARLNKQEANQCPHVWSKWKKTRSGPIIRDGSKTPIGYFTDQARTCDFCGEMQAREVTT